MLVERLLRSDATFGLDLSRANVDAELKAWVQRTDPPREEDRTRSHARVQELLDRVQARMRHHIGYRYDEDTGPRWREINACLNRSDEQLDLFAAAVATAENNINPT